MSTEFILLVAALAVGLVVRYDGLKGFHQAMRQFTWTAAGLLRGPTYPPKLGGGAYRDSVEQQLRASRAKIEELERELASARKSNLQRDEIIGLLFKSRLRDLALIPLRALRDRIPVPSVAQRAFALSALCSCAIIYGVFAMIPSGAPAPERPAIRHVRSHTFVFPFQLTTGDEVTLADLDPLLWRWRCHNEGRVLVAIDSTVLQIPCHLEMPMFMATYATQAASEAKLYGEQAWALWFYPEKQPGQSIAWIRY